MNISVFRKDRKNVGDWYSLPSRYLPLRAQKTYDLAHPDSIPNEPGLVIFGGGGLGRQSFQPFVQKLMRPDRKYKIIAWGVGADSLTKQGEILQEPTDMARLLTYFEGMDDVGTRIDLKLASEAVRNLHWVPCASCLSPLFLELRNTPIRNRFGVYEHLREKVSPHLPGKGRFLDQLAGKYHYQSNRGTDFGKKLKFLAQSEFVITNSYHGVFWATLLQRKVICVPFKNGLFSFRHLPSYLGTDGLEAAMDLAQIYPDALDECREANLNFYFAMRSKYGDV